jgi:hypothetical protein
MAVGVVSAGASVLVPGAGAIIQALAKATLSAPLETRRVVWLNEVGSALFELQQRFEGFDPKALHENESFVSVVAEATQIALKTHQREKLNALKNATLNTAAGIGLSDVLVGQFMAALSIFSPLHLEVLRLSSTPATFRPFLKPNGELTLGSRSDVISSIVTPERANSDVMSVVFGDLGTYKMSKDTHHNFTEEDGWASKMTTSIGDAFLRFISEPTFS